MRRAAPFAVLCVAFALAPAPAFTKETHPGPCRQGDVVSVVDRPGTGPSATNGGAPCTVPEGHVVVEFGYRNEVDAGGKGASSNLASFPMTLVRLGIDKHDEIVYLPPSQAIRAGSTVPDLFTPATGALDSGFGFKHNIHGSSWYQDAVEVFVSVPTGTNGHSLGAPAYSFGYVEGFSPPGRLGIYTSLTLTNGPGTPADGGSPRRYASYGPSLTLSYAIDGSTGAILNDNQTFPATPTGGSSNVLMTGLQRALSPGVVVDVEYEFNLTPETGFHQHAIGFGGAFSL